MPRTTEYDSIVYYFQTKRTNGSNEENDGTRSDDQSSGIGDMKDDDWYQETFFSSATDGADVLPFIQDDAVIVKSSLLYQKLRR